MWEDDTAVEMSEDDAEPSGPQKLMNSLMCAFCVAPLVLLGACYLLGLNEKHAVCESRAIAAGLDVVDEVGCQKTGSETLVLFSCDMQKEGLDFGPAWPGYSRLAPFLPQDMSYQGTGLSVTVEMLQCVENVHTHKQGDRKITTYSYSKEWVSHHVDSSRFRRPSSADFANACGVQNPYWPLGIPMQERVYAPKVKVGAFTIEGHMIADIPLDAPVPLASFPGWQPAGAGTWTNDDYAVHPHASQRTVGSAPIGRLRARIYGTDWSQAKLTVLGHETKSVIRTWKAPSSWLCSGFELSHITRGYIEKDDLFDSLQSTADTKLWIFRILGLGLMWCGYCCLAKPLGVVAGCVPFCGSCLGDAVDTITCALSCLPATACCLLVAGVVWVVMRPMVGGPMLLVSACIFGGLVIQKMNSEPGKAEAGGETELLKPDGEEA